MRNTKHETQQPNAFQIKPTASIIKTEKELTTKYVFRVSTSTPLPLTSSARAAKNEDRNDLLPAYVANMGDTTLMPEKEPEPMTKPLRRWTIPGTMALVTLTVALTLIWRILSISSSGVSTKSIG